MSQTPILSFLSSKIKPQKVIAEKTAVQAFQIKRLTFARIVARPHRLSVSRVFDVTAYYKSKIQSEFSPDRF